MNLKVRHIMLALIMKIKHEKERVGVPFCFIKIFLNCKQNCQNSPKVKKILTFGYILDIIEREDYNNKKRISETEK